MKKGDLKFALRLAFAVVVVIVIMNYAHRRHHRHAAASHVDDVGAHLIP